MPTVKPIAVKFNVPVPPEVYEQLRVVAFNSGRSHSQLVVQAIEGRFNKSGAQRPLKKLTPANGDPKWIRLSVFIPQDLLTLAQTEVDRQVNLEKKPFTGSLTSAIAWLVAQRYARETVAKAG